MLYAYNDMDDIYASAVCDCLAGRKSPYDDFHDGATCKMPFGGSTTLQIIFKEGKLMANLKYDMKEACLNHAYEDGSGKQIQDKDSARIYRRSINSFCSWLKDTYQINNARQLEKAGGAHKYVQEYENKLEAEEKSASTIHTYLSPICKGLGIHLNAITKPHRGATDITRSRNMESNQQGKKEILNQKYKRLVEFQQIVGLRRSELAKLKIGDIARDESGHFCIDVARGKGGKSQLQRILPEDVPKVMQILKAAASATESSGIPREEMKLFTSVELNNKIDLHGMRAEQARRAYHVYLEQCKTPAGRATLQKELVARWNACHGGKDQIRATENGYTGLSPASRRYIQEFSATGDYTMRGENKIRALASGRPISYNRTALLAVSVFHLSHWRNDVTVKHYML